MRELDAEVAEKVMGFSEPITVYRWIDRKKRESPRTMFKAGPKGAWAGYRSYADENGNKLDQLHEVKAYSTDISAAFQVVAKMRERGWDFTLSIIDGVTEAFFIRDDDKDTFGSQCGKSTEEMICLAALKALSATTAGKGRGE